ncbi:hypothetical protein DXG01_010044 [Tephrocybe rancida]|nr:hypothetical protein DXG01_010044 [Tephrocybe rancida]
MKFLSLASLSWSIVTISLVLPGSAAPSDVSPAGAKVIKYVKAHPASLNPPCFWSGHTGSYTAQVVVEKWKGPPRNCHPGSEIIANAGVKESDLTKEDRIVVSRTVAETVAGQTYVLLGKEIRQGATWVDVEKPALERNKKVTGIEIWEIQADGSTKKISG